MKRHLMLLLPILLIGCSEPERNVASAEPEWKAREFERKAKVQSLINHLTDDSHENRQAALTELRDTYIQKRDILELRRAIDRIPRSESESLLWDLIYLDIEQKWRLPNKLWISDLYECAVSWNNKAKNMGCDLSVSYAPDEGLKLHLPMQPEYSTEVINFILNLDPSVLILYGGNRETIINNLFILEISRLKSDLKILGVIDGTYTKLSIQ